MQALILAAGMGKRLKQLTQHATKCMVEVNGVSIIKRMLLQLDGKSLSRIVMVVGYEAQKLVKYVESLNLNTQVEFVVNDIYDKTNNIYSLFLAKDYLEKEDTLLLESDLIFEEKILDKLIEDSYPSLVLVAKFQSWMDGTVVTLDENRKITGMYDKKHFQFERVKSYYKTVNLYKFSKEFASKQYIPFLEAYCKALGHNEYYEQVLKVITMLDQTELRTLCLEDEKWYEIDDVQDLSIAETIFAEGKDKLIKMQNAYGGYWRYPGLLDYCYLVNPYYPPDKLLEELKSNMDTLVCNYPSGQAVNSLLAAKYYGLAKENICVGNGAAELIKSLMEYLEGDFGSISPTFEEYPNRLADNKCVVFHPKNENYSYTADDIMEFYKDREIQNLILINPDNPSGNYIPYEAVLEIADWCRQRGIRLLLDESFADFAEEGKTFLTEETLRNYPSMVIIKSISKSYGVPGIRLGVLASGDKDLIHYMKKNIAIWNINSLGECYLQIFEKYEKEYRQSLQKLQLCRTILYQELEKIEGIEPIPTQANYIMCRLHDTKSADLAENLLNRYNILIKDLSGKKGFENKEYIRIAIRTEEENQLLIEAMGKCLHK